MTLRTRVLVVVAATVALIAVMAVRLFLLYEDTREAVDEAYGTLAPAGTAAADLTADVNAMDRALRIHVASGSEDSRELYETSEESAAEHLEELDGLVGDRPGYPRQLERVSDRLGNWLSSVGEPAMAAMDRGDQARAEALLNAPASLTKLVQVTTAADRLSRRIAEDQQAALDQAAEAANRLIRSVALALGLALLLPLLGYLMLHGQVLRPIERLRMQLRRTASPAHHDAVIEPDGPPEIHDLGTDAEALRRALVREIDESDAARDALEQEGPVVHAIRRELSARADPGPVGVQIAGVLRPAEGVLAGDFWDRIPLGDGRAAVVVCDVSGHGPRAGIVAMRLKTSIAFGLISGHEPTQILHRACDFFVDEPGRFATVVLLLADPRTGTLEWVNAGHPAPRVVRAGGTIERLGPTGPMVSWLVGRWTTGSTRLGPADVCLTFTDGILESRDADGAELGDDALDERLRAAAQDTADPTEVTARVLASVRARADDLGRDDLTLVALRMDGSLGGSIPAPR